MTVLVFRFCIARRNSGSDIAPLANSSFTSPANRERFRASTPACCCCCVCCFPAPLPPAVNCWNLAMIWGRCVLSHHSLNSSTTFGNRRIKSASSFSFNLTAPLWSTSATPLTISWITWAEHPLAFLMTPCHLVKSCCVRTPLFWANRLSRISRMHSSTPSKPAKLDLSTQFPATSTAHCRRKPWSFESEPCVRNVAGGSRFRKWRVYDMTT
mmetsp:Transcript_103545/g.317019  ORF Transcript_103545/g.317019 Transcript_103545/m.317019 type:complete len:212 (-) Transcript_103545:323-958(-)